MLIPSLQLNFLPQANKDSIQIYFSYPNANPRQVEEILTSPLEASINLIEGIDQIKSVSRYGSGYIIATIDDHVDINMIRYEISSKLRQIYPELPQEVPFPFLRLNDSDETAIDPVIMSYSVYAPITQSDIYIYVRDQLAPLLSDLEGLERIDISGSNEEEWLITYDPIKFDHLSLDYNLIGQKVKTVLEEVSLSYQQSDDKLMYVKLLPQTLDDLMSQNIVVGGHLLPLEQLLNVEKTEAIPRRYYRINGQNSIRLNLIPTATANHLDLSSLTKQRIKKVMSSLPNGYRIILDYNTTEYISEELDKIKSRTLWSLSILIAFVMIAYRRWQDLFIIIFSLIINLAISIIFYHLLSVQLNLYALAAITISFGIIIDNTIVLSHHYQRHHNIRVFRPIVTATLTTLSALFVIFYLPEELQLQLVDFTKVLGINLSVSLLVCLLVVPSLIEVTKSAKTHPFDNNAPFASRQSINYKINNVYNKIIHAMRAYRKWLIAATIVLFGLPLFLLPSKLENHLWYNTTIGSGTYQEYIKPWVNKALGGTLRLFSVYVYEGSGFRSPEETKLYVKARLPDGSTIEQMNTVMKKMEYYLTQYQDQVATYITDIGGGHRASIIITFQKEVSPSFPYVLKNRLLSFALDLGGATWNIYGVGKAFSNASGRSIPRFKVILKGYNKDNLENIASQFSDILLEHPRVQNVDKNANINWWEKTRYQYFLEVDHQLLKHTNRDLADVNRLVTRFDQERQRVAVDHNNVHIKIAPLKPDKMDLWMLNETYLYKDSTPILLKKIISLTNSEKSNSIHKENQEYLQLLQFEYSGSDRFGQQHLDKCLEQYIPTLPLGYTISKSNYRFWGEKEKKKYTLLLLVIVSIFFISAIHFESLMTAALVILLIPLSYIGIFLTFYWFDFPFDQGGYTSFLLLSGIVVNALILIMSDYLIIKNRFPHRLPIGLYLRAFRYKSTPIFLTIISTALGLIPFTLHGSQEVFWFALAVGTIGGLLFSIVVILFVVPLFISEGKKEK